MQRLVRPSSRDIDLSPLVLVLNFSQHMIQETRRLLTSIPIHPVHRSVALNRVAIAIPPFGGGISVPNKHLHTSGSVITGLCTLVDGTRQSGRIVGATVELLVENGANTDVLLRVAAACRGLQTVAVE